MTYVAVAIGGSALLGAGVAYAGGKAQERGAERGAEAAEYAADKSAQVQWDMFTKQQEAMQPYRDVGDPALKRLAGLMGIETYTGEGEERVTDPRGADFGKFARPFTMADYEADPGYQFRLAEGQKAIDKGAASRGEFFQGGTGKALTEYGQNLASEEYGRARERYRQDQSDVWNRFSGLSGTGQQAAQQVGQWGQTTAGRVGQGYLTAGGQMANAYQRAGAARASAYEGIGQAGIGAAGNLMFNQYLNKSRIPQ
jgi:hypothetical protein